MNLEKDQTRVNTDQTLLSRNSVGFPNFVIHYISAYVAKKIVRNSSYKFVLAI